MGDTLPDTLPTRTQLPSVSSGKLMPNLTLSTTLLTHPPTDLSAMDTHPPTDLSAMDPHPPTELTDLIPSQPTAHTLPTHTPLPSVTSGMPRLIQRLSIMATDTHPPT